MVLFYLLMILFYNVKNGGQLITKTNTFDEIQCSGNYISVALFSLPADSFFVSKTFLCVPVSENNTES